jgi:hypothetical protein
MSTPDLLALLDREADMLTDDNAHGTAALVREAAATIRRLMPPQRKPIA